jgi:hypothetical protein
MTRKPIGLLAATAATAAATTTYCLVVRPWMTRWGATDQELEQVLPGDDLLSDPAMSITRAITIEATPAEIWPWLVQIGQGRGGFYSYDWLENLFKLDIHTADDVIPELQDLKVDDFISFAPQEGAGMMVASIEHERSLVLLAPDPHFAEALQQQAEEPGFEMEGSWAFVLEPVDDVSTRLIVRLRISHTPSPVAAALLTTLLEPTHFIMERKMLQGIKERVERDRASRSSEQPATVAGVA